MEKTFIHDDFLLAGKTAERLYHEVAESLPIIDFHTHISAAEIAEDRQFANISELWLNTDHYKWRAMRTNGVAEAYCTGEAGPAEKFHRWVETLSAAIGNPLYHWTHLELARWFGIYDRLGTETASFIYETANAQLAGGGFSAKQLLTKSGVTHLCTTDDPVDDLASHQALGGFNIAVLPTFRPDRILDLGQPERFCAYLELLENASGNTIDSLDDLFETLKQRHDFFHEHGCRIADHCLLFPLPAESPLENEKALFAKIRAGGHLTPSQQQHLQFVLLLELCQQNARKGWAQQFHIGPVRNVRSSLFRSFGPDAGADIMGDGELAAPLATLFDALDSREALAKTILYTINPRDTVLATSLVGAFQGDVRPAKMQLGPAWWFMDHEDGIVAHLKALASGSLLCGFVGMVTDSRSLLSFSRHEYFRRILCSYLGAEIERGTIPEDWTLLEQCLRDICYNNAKTYFGF